MSAGERRSIELQLQGALFRVSFGVSADREDSLRNAGRPVPALVPLLAMADTGASNSSVRAGTFLRLGVPSEDLMPVWTARGERTVCPALRGRLHFEGAVAVPITVCEMPLPPGPIEALIGRDVLRHGRLLYDGRDGHVGLVLRGVEIPPFPLTI